MNKKSDRDADTLSRVLHALDERKAKDVVSLDVRRMTTITDHMVIASGTSDRHVKSIADFVVSHLREHGIRESGIEGAAEGEWVLVDVGDVIVHVMQARVRDFYNLEKLWSFGDGEKASVRDS